jgi:hypothetical protein
LFEAFEESHENECADDRQADVGGGESDGGESDEEHRVYFKFQISNFRLGDCSMWNTWQSAARALLSGGNERRFGFLEHLLEEFVLVFENRDFGAEGGNLHPELDDLRGGFGGVHFSRGWGIRVF